MAFELLISFSSLAEVDRPLIKAKVISWLESLGRRDYIEGYIDGIETELTPDEQTSQETSDERFAISPIIIYESDESSARDLWRHLLVEFESDVRVEIHEIDDESWMKCWREEFVAFETRLFFIAPLGDPQMTPSGLRRIEIDARGGAFGTGQHATTRVIIQTMESCFPRWKPQNVLDVGTGTGIYLIIAHHLGVSTLRGTEISSDLVDLAQSNCQMAGISADILLTERPVGPKKFDVVIANILAPVLHDLMGDLVDCLSPQGRLILSGFVAKEQMPLLDAAANAGLKLESEREELGWKCLVLIRQASHN